MRHAVIYKEKLRFLIVGFKEWNSFILQNRNFIVNKIKFIYQLLYFRNFFC